MENDANDNARDKVCDDGGAYEDEEAKSGILFFPPLYIQRYTLALDFLMKHEVKSVIDFGCSDCGFLRLLTTVPSLERIALVDIDHNLLVAKKRVIVPEIRHFIYRRAKPLHVFLFAGSAEDADPRVRGCEAVTLIEVIEHLHADVLQQVTLNVFGVLKPKLCVVTTPNSEFNVLFENSDPKKFRHWDHKFEWTRIEFQKWCSQICDAHGYSVEYTGVGMLPSRPLSAHLGPCSQAAIFTSPHWNQSSEKSVEGGERYELIAESDFPYEKDVMSKEEKIDIEVCYCLHQLVMSYEEQSDPGQPLVIPISRLAEFHSVKALCDEDGVRESLHRKSYVLSEDGLSVFISSADASSEDDLFDDESDDSDGNAEHNCDCFKNLDLNDRIGCTGSEGRNEKSKNVQDSGTAEQENWDLECS